jgi:hypothetical protein
MLVGAPLTPVHCQVHTATPWIRRQDCLDVCPSDPRPLKVIMPASFFDAIRAMMCEKGSVRSREVCVDVGVVSDGRKKVPAIWIEKTECTKFWLRGTSELRDRSVSDLLIAIVDGLKDFQALSMPASFTRRSRCTSCICCVLTAPVGSRADQRLTVFFPQRRSVGGYAIFKSKMTQAWPK